MSFRHSALLARRALTVAAFAGLTMVAACGGDSTGTKGDSYQLFSVDDGSGAQTVPIVVHDWDVTGDTYTLKGGTLTLNDGKYTVRIIETYKASSSASLETFTSGENGTYTLDGDVLTLTSTHDFENGTLTESTGDVTVATKTATEISGDTPIGFVVFKKS